MRLLASPSQSDGYVNPGKDFKCAHLSTALARAGSCKASPAKNAKQMLRMVSEPAKLGKKIETIKNPLSPGANPWYSNFLGCPEVIGTIYIILLSYLKLLGRSGHNAIDTSHVGHSDTFHKFIRVLQSKQVGQDSWLPRLRNQPPIMVENLFAMQLTSVGWL